MISYLAGQIILKTEKSLVVEVRGVGYEIFVTPILLEKTRKNSPVSLYTHLHVREDLMELYGFTSPEDLFFFRQLLGVTNIGPKSALSVMSLATVADLKKAIARGDASLLTKVSGIGQKTAERLILELRNKVSAPVTAEGEDIGDHQAIEALINLGYKAGEARAALQKVDSNLTEVKDRLRAALKMLGKNK